MIPFHIYIKSKFPSLYLTVRSLLFPVVDFFRSKKRKTFSAPVEKRVCPLGTTFTIVLNPANGFIDQHIFATGTYEPDILHIIKKYLNKGDTFVDIGGNIGWHSLIAASIVGEHGSVHTFEPLAHLREQCSRSATINNFSKRITIHPFGCSDKSETVTIHLNPINVGGSSILDTQHVQTTSIELIPADTALGNTSTIALIKIDTEGYELEVLRGLCETLRDKHPVLIIEYSPSFWGENKNYRSDEFFSILSDASYECIDIEDGYKKISNTSKWTRDFAKLQTNLLCLPT